MIMTNYHETYQDNNKNETDRVKLIAKLTAVKIVLSHKRKQIDIYNVPDIEKSLLRNTEWIASLRKHKEI